MIYGWDHIFEKGEYKDLSVLEVFQDNPFYLWFIFFHKGVLFTSEVQAAIETRIMIEEMFVNGDEDDNRPEFDEVVEGCSTGSLGQQVRDMWESEPEPDRVPSYYTQGEEVDTLGLEERDTPLR